MNELDILLGCEESQEVTIELRLLGHNAFSNDIIPCSGGYPEWHYQMDVMEALELKSWDLVILHPPCTFLAVSGNRWYGKGKPLHYKRIEAVEWTQKLWDKAKKRSRAVVMENPVGVLNSMGDFPKPQYIQPWEFGHGETKKTGLWLHSLDPLLPTKIVKGREQRIWKMGPSDDRQKMRSKTYRGIARAMAEQFTAQLSPH